MAIAVSTLIGFVAPADADNVTVSADITRTGWDAAEPGLAPSQVSAADFGEQFHVQLDGSIYAQPLVIGNTVVVTTEKAKAYGISAATGSILWQRSFGSPFQSTTIGCGDLVPDLGSTSTPVYDQASNTIYLTTKIAGDTDPTKPTWYLQAIKAIDGSEQAGFPIQLEGTADNDPAVTFDPFLSMQRSGLLYANGVVYIGFGSHCDIGKWKGWVMAVNATGTLSIRSSWAASGNQGSGAGIWQAGGGLVMDGTDAAGNPRIFLATGNGISPPVGPGSNPPTNLGDSVVRIGLDNNGRLKTYDFFSPADADTLNQNDTDLGSRGPVALPDSFGTASHPHLLGAAGKDGRLFLLDRDSLGGRAQGSGGTDAAIQTVGPYNGVWGHPAAYGGEGGWVYTVENAGPLRAYKRSLSSAGDPSLASAGTSTGTFGYTSGSPVVTSSGTTAGSGLVWVVYSSGASGTGGQLRAYDAVASAGVLNLRWSQAIGNVSKFEMPATSDGRVFVGNRTGMLYAFGRPASTALTGQPVDLGNTAVGSTSTGQAVLTATQTITVRAASTSAPFGVDASALPHDLAAGETFNLPVTFSPTTAGDAAGTLTVSTNLGALNLDLHGLGTKPGLAITPATLDFGMVATSQSKTLAVAVQNTGTTPVTVLSSSPPSGPFTATGLPATGAVIPALGSISVSICYAPTVSASDATTFAVTSAEGTSTLAITGLAVTGSGELTFDPATVDFGNVPLGTSRTLTFDIGNAGNIPITVTKAKAPVGVFSSADPLSEGITIGPDDQVHQEVTFTPSAKGTASATYEVTADDGQGAQYVTLTGNGVAAHALPAPTSSAWTRNGSAQVNGDDLALTQAAALQAGSAFSNATVDSDGLDATFTATIGGGSGADGMTFTMADGSLPATSLGGIGGALGYGGLTPAIAVALDTYQNGNDPSANFVGLATSGDTNQLTYIATSSNIPTLADGSSHIVHVNVGKGRVRVSVDGELKIDAAVAVPAKVRPGFTAGTGGATDQHVISKAQIIVAGEVPLEASAAALTLPATASGQARRRRSPSAIRTCLRSRFWHLRCRLRRSASPACPRRVPRWQPGRASRRRSSTRRPQSAHQGALWAW